jgi:Uma2 family endonuclease
MVLARRPPEPSEVVYPDSDGQPMSDNTLQYEWIVLLKENIDSLIEGFVAGDLLWYPVEGNPKIRIGPDVLVAPERPKGYRGSYMQFREGGIAPKVVVEVLSPNNTLAEMLRKTLFYQRYEAHEILIIDPDNEVGWVYVRGDDGTYTEVNPIDGWTSPTLGIRFVRDGSRLVVLRPDGERFISFGELMSRANANAERAEQEAARADSEAARVRRLEDQLRALGIDPEA